MTTVTDKKIIRKEIKEKRRNMSASDVKSQSELILNRFLSLDEYKNANNILTYVSHDNEVDTISLIRHALKDKKRVAVPKVYGDIMRFHLINDLSDLTPGAYAILEPPEGEIFLPDTGIIIVPGVAFDKDRHRIGYGGGYYDKFLNKNKGLFAVAFAYDFQIVPCIESESFDVKPDMLISAYEAY